MGRTDEFMSDSTLVMIAKVEQEIELSKKLHEVGYYIKESKNKTGTNSYTVHR